MTKDLTDAPSFKRGITRPPFDKTTIRHLMVLQTRHDIHPYTCANRGDGKHEKIGGQSGILVPTIDGWVCPDCDYTQNWVHNSFLNAIIFDVAFDQPSHAPASTAPKEVIEKYADEIWSMVDHSDDPVKTTLESILTRFAAEIGVDALLKVAASKDNEATSHPVWYIVDPRQMMSRDVGRLVSMITGPFFSRESATETMKVLKHRFNNPAVYCDSGYDSPDWVELYEASRAALKSAGGGKNE